jgi:D-sedoheptulose 7-phosphate isomerase
MNSLLLELIKNYPLLNCQKEKIQKSLEVLIFAFENNKKLLICGNGGSAADAMHIVGELMKKFKINRKLSAESIKALSKQTHGDLLVKELVPGLPSISLCSETSLLTACCNDGDPSIIYAQQVYNYGNQGDVLLAISTSGNSKNIVLAAEVAKAKSLKIICLTGENENSQLALLSDVGVFVPSRETYRIQEYHLPIYHYFCAALEEHFFGENK